MQLSRHSAKGWLLVGGGPARGTAILEFALVMPFFFLFIITILQWSHMFYVQQTMQHAIKEAGRLAQLGATEYGGTDFGTVEAMYMAALYSNSMGLLPSANAKYTMKNDRTTNADFGGANATFTVSVAYRYNYATPLVGFFNAFFGPGNRFNDGSNLVVTHTFVAEKYDDQF